MTSPAPHNPDPAADAPRAQTTIIVPNSQPMVALLGTQDEFLRLVENAFPTADIMARGNEITVGGSPEEVGVIDTLIGEMLAVLRTGQPLTAESVERSISLMRSGTRPTEVLTANILSNRGRTIRPKTLNQKRYVDAIDHHTIVFGIGPAGTGKTYLAVAKAVQALNTKAITRIILTRPAVEAGERLGFLPGTLSEKIDPYLRPLYDALHDMIDPDLIPRLMTSGTIEVAPLAFMRGRTLNDSFIILDEAQNTSPEQMKMFLTRLGFGSKMVVTGDVTQIDLPHSRTSGLVTVPEVLDAVDDISIVRFDGHDVVRHKLVQRIVNAYRAHDELDAARKAQASGARAGDGRDGTGVADHRKGAESASAADDEADS